MITYLMPSGIAKATGRSPAFKHGGTGTPEYKVWKNIKARCFNPRFPDFRYYGGRGITMADEWINDFPAFLAHIGKRPSAQYTLDRIDNDGDYAPGNVRWATRSEQSNNSRRCRMITFRGATLPLAAQCRKWGVKIPSLEWWIYRKGRDPVAGLEHYIEDP